MQALIKDEYCLKFFQYFGLAVFSFYAIKTLMRIVNNLSSYFLGSGAIDFKKYGSWCVVTGCTDGIGEAYVKALAKKGMNVVLISRSIDKLQTMSDELIAKHSIQTKCIAADFTEPKKIYADIKQQLNGLEIALLVNNVGMSYKYPEYFGEIEDVETFSENIINCNVMSVTKMNPIVLPGMVKRGGGVIVNNASASGRISSPMLTVYSATKAYMDFFSRGLKVEYAAKGIIVQSLCPFFVATKLAGMRKSLMAPEPSQFVASALKTIGTQPVTNGCLVHNIQGYVVEDLMPSSFVEKMTFDQMRAANKKAKARLERKKETSKEK